MIQVNELCYRYPNAVGEALQGLNFMIEEGEVFGFLGPSGSGKSTTQKILFKLLAGYTGSARIDGREVRDWGAELYERIGVGFELPNHYLKLTALENLHFFKNFYVRHRDPQTLLDRVGLGKYGDKKVADFSKGMKMRLNFVRAFLHDPDILFLDEPTSGLDPVNAKLVKDVIRELQAEGKTIFLTTHHMHDADELCDRVAFLVDGTIRALDKPAHLKLQYSERKVVVQFEGATEVEEFELEDLGRNAAFLQKLQTQSIETIHSQEASLEDIFIAITGKTLT